MEAQRSQFAVKLLPSLADFAFLMPIVFLFVRMEGVKTLLTDCDTGWHIRTGDWIVANHGVPAHDIFLSRWRAIPGTRGSGCQKCCSPG